MASISDLDRGAFESACRGVHDFNEEEQVRLHKAAAEVKAVVQSANDRQRKIMMARNQLR
jgi:hypothetical protein